MTVSFTYGLVSSIASELPQLEPGKEQRERLGYIYASDGKTVLAVLRGSENRIVVGSEEISPVMKQAIVAVEDRRFWEHQGVDMQGMARAVWADIRSKTSSRAAPPSPSSSSRTSTRSRSGRSGSSRRRRCRGSSSSAGRRIGS